MYGTKRCAMYFCATALLATLFANNVGAFQAGEGDNFIENLHSLPRYNLKFEKVSNEFDLESGDYIQSMVSLSLPGIIVTLLVFIGLVAYLFTFSWCHCIRCCRCCPCSPKRQTHNYEDEYVVYLDGDDDDEAEDDDRMLIQKKMKKEPKKNKNRRRRILEQLRGFKGQQKQGRMEAERVDEEVVVFSRCLCVKNRGPFFCQQTSVIVLTAVAVLLSFSAFVVIMVSHADVRVAYDPVYNVKSQLGQVYKASEEMAAAEKQLTDESQMVATLFGGISDEAQRHGFQLRSLYYAIRRNVPNHQLEQMRTMWSGSATSEVAPKIGFFKQQLISFGPFFEHFATKMPSVIKQYHVVDDKITLSAILDKTELEKSLYMMKNFSSPSGQNRLEKLVSFLSDTRKDILDKLLALETTLMDNVLNGENNLSERILELASDIRSNYLSEGKPIAAISKCGPLLQKLEKYKQKGRLTPSLVEAMDALNATFGQSVTPLPKSLERFLNNLIDAFPSSYVSSSDASTSSTSADSSLAGSSPSSSSSSSSPASSSSDYSSEDGPKDQGFAHVFNTDATVLLSIAAMLHVPDSFGDVLNQLVLQVADLKQQSDELHETADDVYEYVELMEKITDGAEGGRLGYFTLALLLAIVTFVTATFLFKYPLIFQGIIWLSFIGLFFCCLEVSLLFPVSVMTADLCVDMDDVIMEGVNTDKPYLPYYLLCKDVTANPFKVSIDEAAGSVAMLSEGVKDVGQINFIPSLKETWLSMSKDVNMTEDALARLTRYTQCTAIHRDYNQVKHEICHDILDSIVVLMIIRAIQTFFYAATVAVGVFVLWRAWKRATAARPPSITIQLSNVVEMSDYTPSSSSLSSSSPSFYTSSNDLDEPLLQE